MSPLAVSGNSLPNKILFQQQSNQRVPIALQGAQPYKA